MEPRIISSSLFAQLNDAARVAGRYLPEPIASGVDFASSLAQASRETFEIGVSPEFQELIDKQIEVQTEMQQVSFTSNIERSRHETNMAAIRNIRVN